MYSNPFIYKRPLQPGQDELITIRREALLAKAISGLEFGHWFHVGGGKKIGKTSFLLALMAECRMRERPYHFILIKTEELSRLECPEFYRVLCRRLQELCGDEHELSKEYVPPVPDLEDFKHSLSKATHALAPAGRLIVMLDGLEALPRDFAQEFFRAMLHVHQCQSLKTLPENFQFILSGALNTHDLQIERGHSLSEYAMKFFLDDFKCEDLEAFLGRIATALEIDWHPALGRLLYETTGGTAYLVQKICYRILERAFMRHEQPKLGLPEAEAAIASILTEGETNVEMLITQIEQDIRLVECVLRTLRAGTVSSARFDPHLKALVALGALSEQNGFYRVRNRIYETAFRDYFTTERLADHYFELKQYDRARELFAVAASEQVDARNALNTLLGNLSLMDTQAGQSNLVKNILQAFMNALDNTKNCSLMRLEQAGGRLRIVDAIGMSSEEIQAFELQVGQGVAGWVAQAGRFRVIRDVTDEIECPDFAYREMAQRLNFRAMASFPLKASGGILGVVNLCLGKPRQFSNCEINMLEALTAYAARVLESSQSHRDLGRHQHHLEQLRALLHDATHQTDLKSSFKKILDMAEDVIGTNKVYLVYRKHEAARWRFVLGKGNRAVLRKLPDVEQGEGIAGHVLKTGAPYFIEDATRNQHYFAVWPEVFWELAMPCVVDGVARGCLVVAGESAPRLSPPQTQFLAMLAEAVALALKNRQLYFIAEKKTQQVITARSIGETLSHENSLQEILKLIAGECLNVVGRENKIAFVWLKDRERGKLILKAASGEPFGQKYIGKARSLEKKSLVIWALKNGLPALVPDVRKNRFYRATHPDIKSELAVPLIFHDEIIGVLDVQSTRLNDFDEQDLEALIAVSLNAAVAVKVGERYDISKELEVLYRIGTKISSSLKVREVLRTICREILKAPGSENRMVNIHLIDPETQLPSLYIRQDTGGHESKLCTCSAWPHSRCQWVAQNKRHYLSPEIGNDPLYVPGSEPVNSAVFVPIIYDERVSGVISVESLLADDFGEAELRFLKGVANQAGVAIENARLSEDLSKAQMGVTKALEGAAIEEAVTHFSHDIKSISSMIAGETQWLARLEREKQLDFNEVDAAIKNIDSYVKRIDDFTSDLRGRAYKEQAELRWCNLQNIVEDASYIIAAKARRQAVELQKADSALDLQLYADPERLARAFFNIMANALDAMPQGGVLLINAQTENGCIRIDFSDTGIGIPEEILNKVFDLRFTTKRHGFGVGLTLAKRIIEANHHGKLSLQSRIGNGTTVTVRLPLDLHRRQDQKNKSLLPASVFHFTKNASLKAGNILVVNDDSEMLDKIVQFLSREGYCVTGTESGKIAVERCKTTRFDLMVLDYHLKKDHSETQTAVDFVPELKKSAPGTPIILTSATLDQLGSPEMYCDFFLEINQSFWGKILDLVNNCLLPKTKWQHIKPLELREGQDP